MIDRNESDRRAEELGRQAAADQETIDGLRGQADADRATIRGLEDQAQTDRDTIRGLEDQAQTDRDTIRGLEDQGALDQALIDQLVAEGVVDREKIANLEIALATARQIGAAMGVLMARQQLTHVAAFDLLRETSHASHRKLRDIAETVVLTGALPQRPAGG